MSLDWNKIYSEVTEWIITRGPGVLLAIAVFIAGMLLIRMINKSVRKRLERKNVHTSVRYFLQNLFSVAAQLLLIIVCLQIAGFQLTIFSAIVAGITVAAGLALSGTLQNFVSGILILFMKPYRIGDTINTGGQEGIVTTIQLFYTVVVTADNKTIIIPNGQLSNSMVMNLSKEGRRRMDIDLEFGASVDLKKVRTALENAVKAAVDVLPRPDLRIGVSAIKSNKYTLTLNVWTGAHGFYDAKIALNERIMEELKAAKVDGWC